VEGEDKVNSSSYNNKEFLLDKHISSNDYIELAYRELSNER